MRKCFLFILVFFSFNCFLYSETSFDLVLTKQGESRIYFSDGNGNDLYDQVELYTADNSKAVSATLYFGYDLYPNLVATTDERLKMTLTFSSGPTITDEDYMLKHTTLEQGLLYDYTITTKEGNNALYVSEKITFNKRSNVAPLTGSSSDIPSRQVTVFSNKQLNASTSALYRIDISINPPGETEDNVAFTTGQYTGYIILTLENN